jgi:hypothetical protein
MKDDTELRGNYLSHTVEIGLNCGSHFGHFQRRIVLLPFLQLPNAMLISLLMHCFCCKLTSRTSQALLQVPLDKESSYLPGWLLLREFSKLPSSTATFRAMPVDRTIGNHRNSHQWALAQLQGIPVWFQDYQA